MFFVFVICRIFLAKSSLCNLLFVIIQILSAERSVFKQSIYRSPPNLTSNFDTVSLISSIVPGRCKYFGLKISFIALQTLDAVFETVL